MRETGEIQEICQTLVTYIPGSVDINEKELEDYIRKCIERKELVMEAIPLKILNYLVEKTAHMSSRYAAPNEIQIVSHSKGKTKKWRMMVNVGFKREIRDKK